MAKEIIVNGYTFTLGNALDVVCSGPGIRLPKGATIADNINTLSLKSFQGWEYNPNFTPEAAAALAAFTQSDVEAIKEALIYKPPPAEPVPPATSEQQTEQQNKQYIASGGADDDKGNAQPTTTTENSASAPQSLDEAPQQTIEPIVINKNKGNNTPTARANPLSYFSSYTYQVSLYMVTPDAYNAFVQSDFTNLNDLVAKTKTGGGSVDGGAYLLMQSGGINRENTPPAPGFNLDFFIENLNINSLIAPNATGASTTTTEISFQVLEPYGFSFLTKLKQAAMAISAYSNSLNLKEQPDPSRYFFVLGLKFYGYDAQGNLMNGKEMINGKVLDPSGSSNGLFQTYYPLTIKKINFKIDGKSTTYNITAVSLATNLYSTQYSSIDKNMTIQATTVEEALVGKNGLIEQLNAYQESLKTEIPHKYKIEFIGPIDQFKSASIVAQKDVLKYRWGYSNAQNVEQVNEKTAAETSPKSNERIVTIAKGSHVLTAIEQIAKQSSYMINALKTLYTTELENNSQTGAEDKEPISASAKIKWYNVASQVKILGYDTKTRNWAYETTYVISPYETPIVLSPYIKNVSEYYGPVKAYEYWFTGQNSEVLHYEQTNENGYYISVIDIDTASTNGKSGQANIPMKPNTNPNADTQGGLYAATSAQVSFLATDLFDPKSYSQAKIQILGDPDFLMRDSFNNKISAVYNQFYSTNGTTINPGGGQVFIELSFKEGVDYNDKTGLMDINDSIVFWQYPAWVKKIVKNGVSYRVIKVLSSFKGGKFIQELHCIINTFGFTPSQAAGGEQRDDSYNESEMQKFKRQGSAGAVSATKTGGAAVGNAGLKTAPKNKPTPPTNTPSQVNKQQNEEYTLGVGTFFNEGGRE